MAYFSMVLYLNTDVNMYLPCAILTQKVAQLIACLIQQKGLGIIVDRHITQMLASQ
jgi:hypothetical protein